MKTSLLQNGAAMMYEHKGICPFIESCDYYKKIIRLERELNGDRRKAILRLKDERDYEDEVFVDIQKQYESIKRLRERCFEKHGRCLRFWRLRKNRNDMPASVQELDIATRIES